MVDLVLRPSGRSKPDPLQWQLQLRYEREDFRKDYVSLCLLNDWQAQDVIRAGQAIWLLGEPDWNLHGKQFALAKAEADVARLRAEIAARTGE